MSVTVDILFRAMQLKILHVSDNRVMPHQLLQFPKSPFFGSLITVLCLSSGMSSSSQIFWIWQRIWVSLVHLLLAFPDMSLPGAFPFFWALMPSLPSASVTWSRLISRSSACLRNFCKGGWVCTTENLLEMLISPQFLDCDDLSICVFQ